MLTAMPPFLRSELLATAGFRHAFSTRCDGVSVSLRGAEVSADRAGQATELVAEGSLRRAAEVLGIEAGRLFFLSQVHGTQCRRIGRSDDPAAVAREQGDVTLSAAVGVACGVRTADCVPVLLADRRSGAVAAVHAGWRGTVRGVVAVAVQRLEQLTGAGASLVAAVGPHIGRCCFEVGEDVAAELAAASVAGEAAVERTAGRPRVDLRRIIEAQLSSAGVAAVDHVPGCTQCDAARFHSYRRDGPRSGRMLATIAVRAGR